MLGVGKTRDLALHPPAFVRDSLLQEAVGGKVRCNVCERRCLLPSGGTGWCRTRINLDGKLLALNYGAVSSVEVNPIEKKPFYHFYPGTKALTAGGWSCNFGCPWCQNWHISKVPPPAESDFMSPTRFVRLVEKTGAQGTSISFNEPTLSFEWSLEVFRLAREAGYYNTFVTNGYMTPEALDLLVDAGLHALNIDIKGDAETMKHLCKMVEVEKVWASAVGARARGLHVELTTLVIPGVNDSDGQLTQIARRIADGLGRDVPWHLTAYFPAYRWHTPPTSAETLDRAWSIGSAAGLNFVYLGNVLPSLHDDTVCPRCGRPLIRRVGLAVLENLLAEGRCPQCQEPIPGVWA